MVGLGLVLSLGQTLLDSLLLPMPLLSREFSSSVSPPLSVPRQMLFPFLKYILLFAERKGERRKHQG